MSESAITAEKLSHANWKVADASPFCCLGAGLQICVPFVDETDSGIEAKLARIGEAGCNIAL